jgi:hypothetical protein
MYGGGEMFEADIQMNSDMEWSDPVFLENVLLHELGHAMGMDHEDDVPAVMASFVTGTTDLEADDVAGIVALYGTGAGSDGVGGGGAPPPPPPSGGGGGSSGGDSDDGDGGGGGGGGHKSSGCFVATASWGPASAPVRDLKAFRARWLHPSPAGRAFDRAYHGFGPAAASAVGGASLQAGSRAVLAPFALAARGGGLSGVLALAALLFFLALARRRM